MPVAHKSAISVGLLYIPVGLYNTTRNASISFNQLCKDSKERIRYKKYCPSCDILPLLSPMTCGKRSIQLSDF